MPELAKRQYNRQQYRINYYGTDYQYRENVRTGNKTVPLRRTVDSKKVARNNLIHRIISVAVVSVLGFTILPYGFNRVTKLMFNPTPYKEVKADYHKLLFPTSDYISNHWFLGQRSLEGAEIKKPAMTVPVENKELTGLENQLKNLASMYPSIHPSIYVWDYDTGNYAGLDSDKLYSEASIIKIPVLIQLFRSIEAGQLTIYDTMTLTDYYRAEGSGSSQFKAENSVWTMDDLARVMITESDNSATNMIMAKLGSMNDINSGIRQWGLSHTRVNTWLPDMGGTNFTTAEDLARMLYNLDNPNFLSVKKKKKIFDYMGHIHNDRLIPAGLGAGAVFIHKTGDIGKMLGDAGIVYAPNGKKYIVAILVNRPYNSPLGKDFIVKASEIIYNTMTK